MRVQNPARSAKLRLAHQKNGETSVQEFLLDWFGVYLSTATINQCIHETGRAVAPLELQLAEEIRQADLLYADETTWKEAGLLLWLWVFCSATVTLY